MYGFVCRKVICAKVFPPPSRLSPSPLLPSPWNKRHSWQGGSDQASPLETGRSYLRGIPSVAHQRLSPAAVPAYTSPLMPYLLMDEDDIVVLPRRRHYARVHEELDDDPVLQWYEDRIHHAQAEAIANANKRVTDLCTPRPRYISTAPPYNQGRYKEPVPPRFNKYRPPMTEAMKPIRSNIEIKSRFNKAQNAADHDYRRIAEDEPSQGKATKADTTGEAHFRLLPISGIPGTFRMVATGERPKRKGISEEPELSRHSTWLASDEALNTDQDRMSRSPRADMVSQQDDDADYDDDYYDYSPEPEYERGCFAESEGEEEDLCPELEPASGKSGYMEQDHNDEPDTASPEFEQKPQTPYECSPEPETEPEPEPDPGELSQDHNLERELSPEVLSEDDLLIRRRYEEDQLEAEPTPERDEDALLKTFIYQDDIMEESAAVPDTMLVEEYQDDCNMMDQMVITLSQDGDEPQSSDASDGSRAKLTQMKSEAAQRLDELEKLIDEHQEIVEKLKRTESNQGSLADLASLSGAASPAPSPARGATLLQVSASFDNPETPSETAQETDEPTAQETADKPSYEPLDDRHEPLNEPHEPLDKPHNPLEDPDPMLTEQ